MQPFVAPLSARRGSRSSDRRRLMFRKINFSRAPDKWERAGYARIHRRPCWSRLRLVVVSNQRVVILPDPRIDRFAR